MKISRDRYRSILKDFFERLSVRIFFSFALISLLSTILCGIVSYHILYTFFKEDYSIRLDLILKEAQRILNEEYLSAILSKNFSEEIVLLKKKEAYKKLETLFQKNQVLFWIYENNYLKKGSGKHVSKKGLFREINFNPWKIKVIIGLNEKKLTSSLKRQVGLLVTLILFFTMLGPALGFLFYFFQLRRPLLAISKELSAPKGDKLSPVGLKEFDELIERINESIERERTLFERIVISEKMAALGTLAGGYAHEFNNLLQIILGHLNLLRHKLSSYEIPNEILAKLETAEKATIKGSEISQKLLLFAREDVKKQESACVVKVLKDLKEVIETSFPKNIKIKFDFPQDLPPVKIREEELREILFNLSLNARDAMKDGGLLLIKARESTSKVEFILRDTGCGMDENTKRRIFEPFFTTKPPGEGTGLGLYIVYQIVQKVGGEIEVKSRPEEGTCFYIRLPIAELPQEKREEKLTIKDKLPSKGKALVVDDEADLRDLIIEFLQSIGFESEEASSAEEAFQIWCNSSEKFSLLIVDLIMPGKGGGWLIEKVLQDKSPPTVIVMTGYPGEAHTILKKMASQVTILKKPFTLESLKETIYKVYEGKT